MSRGTHSTVSTNSAPWVPMTCDFCEGNGLRPHTVDEVGTFWKCDACGLLQKGTSAPRHVIPWRELEQEGTDSSTITTDIRLSRIAMVLTSPRPSLLDVACESSPTLVRAAELGWRATAVLENPRAVANYRRRGLTAYHAPASLLPFPTDFFDVVTAWFTLESVTDAKAALREWQRVLRPGGILVLEAFRARSLERIAHSPETARTLPPLRYGFSPQVLRGLAEHEHFEILPSPGLGRLELLSLRVAATSVWHHVRTAVQAMSGTSPTFQIFCRRPTRVSALHYRQRAA